VKNNKSLGDFSLWNVEKFGMWWLLYSTRRASGYKKNENNNIND